MSVFTRFGDQPQRTLLLLAVVSLLFVAGCSAGLHPRGVEQSAEPRLVLNNTADDTHTFAVWVLEGPVREDAVTVYYRDKEPASLSPQGGVYHRHFPEEHTYVTQITPDANRSRFVTQVAVDPGETYRQNVTEFAVGDALMVTAAKDDRIFELVVANCDEESLVGLEVMSRPEPSTANSFECR